MLLSNLTSTGVQLALERFGLSSNMKYQLGVGRANSYMDRLSTSVNNSVLKAMKKAKFNPGSTGWKMTDYFGSTATGIIRDGLQEGITEWAQSVSDDMIDTYGFEEGGNILDNLANAATTDEAVQSFWGGAIGGSSMGGSIGALNNLSIFGKGYIPDSVVNSAKQSAQNAANLISKNSQSSLTPQTNKAGFVKNIINKVSDKRQQTLQNISATLQEEENKKQLIAEQTVSKVKDDSDYMAYLYGSITSKTSVPLENLVEEGVTDEKTARFIQLRGGQTPTDQLVLLYAKGKKEGVKNEKGETVYDDDAILKSIPENQRAKVKALILNKLKQGGFGSPSIEGASLNTKSVATQNPLSNEDINAILEAENDREISNIVEKSYRDKYTDKISQKDLNKLILDSTEKLISQIDNKINKQIEKFEKDKDDQYNEYLEQKYLEEKESLLFEEDVKNKVSGIKRIIKINPIDAFNELKEDASLNPERVAAVLERLDQSELTELVNNNKELFNLPAGTFAFNKAGQIKKSVKTNLSNIVAALLPTPPGGIPAIVKSETKVKIKPTRAQLVAEAEKYGVNPRANWSDSYLKGRITQARNAGQRAKPKKKTTATKQVLTSDLKAAQQEYDNAIKALQEYISKGEDVNDEGITSRQIIVNALRNKIAELKKAEQNQPKKVTTPIDNSSEDKINQYNESLINKYNANEEEAKVQAERLKMIQSGKLKEITDDKEDIDDAPQGITLEDIEREVSDSGKGDIIEFLDEVGNEKSGKFVDISPPDSFFLATGEDILVSDEDIILFNREKERESSLNVDLEVDGKVIGVDPKAILAYRIQNAPEVSSEKALVVIPADLQTDEKEQTISIEEAKKLLNKHEKALKEKGSFFNTKDEEVNKNRIEYAENRIRVIENAIYEAITPAPTEDEIIDLKALEKIDELEKQIAAEKIVAEEAKYGPKWIKMMREKSKKEGIDFEKEWTEAGLDPYLKDARERIAKARAEQTKKEQKDLEKEIKSNELTDLEKAHQAISNNTSDAHGTTKNSVISSFEDSDASLDADTIESLKKKLDEKCR
tara:strand:- start:28 stop:3198 length:3171 start_codon:yes stop_codon:yes gene_type:complete